MAERSSFSRSLCLTPKCCSSSTIEQAEVAELDRLAEQRMRADDDVDRAVGDALLDARELGRADQARGLADIERQAAKALDERLGVLAGEQRGGDDDGDLLAVHGGDEGGAQRHLRLAEADVAADQPVHGAAGDEVVDGGVDRRHLVVGLLVGEAGGELVGEAGGRRQLGRLAHEPRGGRLDELVRHVADALLQPRLAVLPADAAELVEIGLRALRAVAGEELDVFHRQEQPVVAGIDELQAIVRRAGRLDGLQPGEAADAVVDVHDEVAGGEARHLGQRIGGALALAGGAHQAVAEHVLVADDGEVGRLEARFERQHGEPGGGLRQRLQVGERLDLLQRGQAVVDQHLAEAVARALAPGGEHHLAAGLLQRRDVRDERVEDVDVAGGALGGEGAPCPAAHVDRRAAFLRLTRKARAARARRSARSERQASRER